MKKHIFSFGAFLLLAACGGSSSSGIACDMNYWDGTVGTCLPFGWHVVEREQLDEKGVPAEVVAAFQSNEPVAGQFATVTVTREVLSRKTSSTDYSKASVLSVKELPEYEEVDQQALTINGEEVILHTFIAQPRPDEPSSRFFQVSIAAGSTGYSYTAATPVSVSSDLEDQILLILSNATLQEQVEGEE